MNTSSAPSPSEGVTQEVIDLVDCPECDSEAGYECTYMPPKVKHKASTPGRKALLERVGTTTKKPHAKRYQKYWAMKKREAQERRQQELTRQRELREERARKEWARRNETQIAYKEYGRREAVELGAWLRDNWRIFRIDEEF